TVAGGPRRSSRGRLVVTGTGLALAIALPAALVAQVADTLADDDPPVLLAAVLVVLVYAGVAVGGWGVGDRAARDEALRRARVPLGAASGLLAITVVQAIGVARRLVADEDVAWSSVPVVLATATGVAALAAWRASQAVDARQG